MKRLAFVYERHALHHSLTDHNSPLFLLHSSQRFPEPKTGHTAIISMGAFQFPHRRGLRVGEELFTEHRATAALPMGLMSKADEAEGFLGRSSHARLLVGTNACKSGFADERAFPFTSGRQHLQAENNGSGAVKDRTRGRPQLLM